MMPMLRHRSSGTVLVIFLPEAGCAFASASFTTVDIYLPFNSFSVFFDCTCLSLFAYRFSLIAYRFSLIAFRLSLIAYCLSLLPTSDSAQRPCWPRPCGERLPFSLWLRLCRWRRPEFHWP